MAGYKIYSQKSKAFTYKKIQLGGIAEEKEFCLQKQQ